MHIAQWQSWVMFKTLPFTAFCCIWDKTHVISADRLKMKQIFSYLVIVTQCPAYLFSPSVSSSGIVRPFVHTSPASPRRRNHHIKVKKLALCRGKVLGMSD